MLKSGDSSNDNKENHVFIVGLPRTGTTIIYRTIQELPSFRAAQLNFWETNIFRDYLTFDAPDLNYESLLGYFFYQKDIYNSFLEAVKEYTGMLRVNKEDNNYEIQFKDRDSVITPSVFQEKNKPVELRWKESRRIKIIREYFNFAGKCRNSKRLVEKTPHHYLHVHQILWTFPDARIIWMIRHPIDIITSSIKRAKIDKNYSNYWRVDNFIKEFKGSFSRLAVYQRHFARNIRLVKYEDFVNNPVKEFKKICEFIDEPFCKSALKNTRGEMPNWKSPDRYLFSKIVHKTEKNWKDHISPGDAEKIETELQDLMKEYHFDFFSKKIEIPFSPKLPDFWGKLKRWLKKL